MRRCIHALRSDQADPDLGRDGVEDLTPGKDSEVSPAIGDLQSASAHEQLAPRRPVEHPGTHQLAGS